VNAGAIAGPRILGAIATIALVLLAWGGAAGAHPWDVGELAAAAARLGGSHAPGQPLHALAGHAIGWLPLGSFVARLSWLSAIGAAWAAYATGRAVLAGGSDDAWTRAAAACAALGVLLLPAVLRNAMRPEVYTLALACVASSGWALVLRDRRWPHGLRVAALLAGLAFALHPPHALAIAAMGIVACVLRRPRARELGSAIAIGGVVTVALVAYLPIRAAAGAPCWGDPTTMHGLWAYVSGAAYQRNLGAHDRDALAVAGYLLGPGGGAVLVFAIAALRQPKSRLPWSMAIVAAIAALLQPFEERNPDNVAYDAPALVLALAAAAGVIARAPGMLRATCAIVPAVPLVAAIACGSLVSSDLPELETLAFETTSSPAPRALLVSRSDFVGGAVMLAQDVDRLRPDLAHLVEGLATSSWHWRALAAHPAFDGSPHRGPGTDARVAYVLGAIEVARAAGIEIDVERADLLPSAQRWRGALHGTGPAGIDDRSTAERTMGALASTLRWGPRGDHEAASQIVRDVVMRRAERLVTDRIETLRSELTDAAPAAADRIALVTAGPLDPITPIRIRDPHFFAASEEDVVRFAAVLMWRRGDAVLGIQTLGAQQSRGDDLSIAQLAALQLASGRLDEARASFAVFRAREPDVSSPELDALAAALAR
jgi:hypothetical protein